MFAPGRFRCKHLNYTAPEAPNVCWLAMARFHDDFRSHPVGRADECLIENCVIDQMVLLRNMVMVFEVR